MDVAILVRLRNEEVEAYIRELLKYVCAYDVIGNRGGNRDPTMCMIGKYV